MTSRSGDPPVPRRVDPRDPDRTELRPSGILVVFLDGVGIGPPNPDTNPFFQAELPALWEALGGKLPHLRDPFPQGPAGSAFPIDACLDVPGIPQSGTGQVALLTGQNAPLLFGRHFGPWPPVRLRPLLEEENFLKRARDAGRRVVFANAYPQGYPEGRDPRRVAAPALAAGSAGLLVRDHEALSRGTAIASEIVNDGWRDHLGFRDLPAVTPEAAGRNLARIAESADLTFFAHYHTDLAGHRGGMSGSVRALETVDRFLAGILSTAPGLPIFLVSDHGNLEDIRRGHTLNPALGMMLGPWPPGIPRPGRLTDVAELLTPV